MLVCVCIGVDTPTADVIKSTGEVKGTLDWNFQAIIM